MFIRDGEKAMKLYEFFDDPTLSLETHKVRAHVMGVKAEIVEISKPGDFFEIIYEFEYQAKTGRASYVCGHGELQVAVRPRRD